MSRNLAFRDKTTHLDDDNGNVLGTLEQLAHYDPLLNKNLQRVRQKKTGSRLTHYWSPDTQNEFIYHLCNKRVKNTMLAEREDEIYYSVICISTPDISHIEQNMQLVRYVYHDKESGSWEIIERFIQLKDFDKKTEREISELIKAVLEENAIQLKDWSGQGYDNGANMLGKVNGV